MITELHLRSDLGGLSKKTASLSFNALYHNLGLVIQLHSVFAFLMAPTEIGIARLNAMKDRDPDKTYGTVASNFGWLYANTLPEWQELPHVDRDLWEEVFVGSFVRVPVKQTGLHRKLLCQGTHQTLFLREPGVYGEFFTYIERAFEACGIWPPHPIATSLNRSVVQSSIVEYDKARVFLYDRCFWEVRGSLIPYLLLAPDDMNPLEDRKSTPVFSVTRAGFCMTREGPGATTIVKRLRSEGFEVTEALEKSRKC